MNSMMNGSNAILVDTNVLIYAYDAQDREKQKHAAPVRPSHGAVDRDSGALVQCIM